MKQIIDLLESYEPTPRYAQFANAGNWEEAIRIDFTDTASYDTASVIDVDDSIAGEVFYELNDGRAIFFGIRYSSILKVASPNDFIEKFIATLKFAPGSSLKFFMNVLGEQLNKNPETFISVEINHVELGVEGYWKSVGSKVLRTPNQPTTSKEKLLHLLSDSSNLLKNTKNNTALEFAVRSPEFWLGVQVSTKENDEYITDLATVAELSNKI